MKLSALHIASLCAGAFALWYLLPAYALMQLKFSLAGFSLSFPAVNRTDVNIDLELANPTAINAVVTGIQADMFINGEYFSRLYYQGRLAVPGRGTQLIRATLSMEPEKLTKTVWNNLVANNFRDTVITFSGSVYSNGRMYPFNTDLDLSAI